MFFNMFDLQTKTFWWGASTNGNKLTQDTGHTLKLHWDHRSVIPGLSSVQDVSHWPGWKTWGVSASVGGVWDHWRLPLSQAWCGSSANVMWHFFGHRRFTFNKNRCKSRVYDKQQNKKTHTDCRIWFYDAQGKVASNQEEKKWRNPPIVWSRPEDVWNHLFEVVVVHWCTSQTFFMVHFDSVLDTQVCKV